MLVSVFERGGDETREGMYALGQLVVREGVGVGALAVELFLGEGGAGVDLVGFAVFFALLALGWGGHWGGERGHGG